MNSRERFLGVLNYSRVDRVSDLEMGFWEGTLARWRQEGMPESVVDQDSASEHFGFERQEMVNVDYFAIPPLGVSNTGEGVLREDGDFIIYKDTFGNICRKPKKGHTIPQYLRYVIESRSDWERIKPRFDASLPGRFPPDWEERKRRYRHRQIPLRIQFVSLFGWLRSMMGVERCCIAFLEDRPLIEDIQEHLTNFYIELMQPVFEEIGGCDFATVWEDMCYNKGPLISPKLYAETAIPRYKRIISVLHDYGIKLVMVDCDGKIDELVPVWLEAGINVMTPVEVAHTNAEALRRKYGRELRFIGGIDKRALARGKEAIDRELQRVEALAAGGGFIPHVDHAVPEDVSYENFLYYLRRKREMLRNLASAWQE